MYFSLSAEGKKTKKRRPTKAKPDIRVTPDI